MMETNAVSNNVQALASATPLSRSNVARDDFLKLLVAQMSNQDPLAPVDNQEFAAQLAQFSSLEQLQSIDENIKYGIDMDLVLTQTINNTLASTIIGKQAKAVGDIVALNSSAPSNIYFDLENFADDIKVNVTDNAGSLVRVLSVKGLFKGEHSISWDGKNDNGEMLPEGTYHFSIQASDADGNSVSATPLMVGIVSGVHYENGNAVLLIGGERVSFASIIEIGIADD